MANHADNDFRAAAKALMDVVAPAISIAYQSASTRDFQQGIPGRNRRSIPNIVEAVAPGSGSGSFERCPGFWVAGARPLLAHENHGHGNGGHQEDGLDD